MRILSLFDGIACGYEALLRAGIKIDAYYASEIDKYAIQIAKKNHPDIIEIGDVTQVKAEDYMDVDMIIGGSPCQGFSMAGKQLNFNDERSKLFFEFVRLVQEIKPKYFLLENVKMKKEFSDKITEIMGVQPIEIDSALVSAQRRKRLYWTNIPGVEQPKDKGIMLKDILEHNVDEKYNISETQWNKILSSSFDSNKRLSPLEGKSYTLSTMQGGYREPKIAYAPGSREYYSNGWKTEKSPTLCARDYKDPKVVAIQLGNSDKFGNKTNDKGKSYTMRASHTDGVIEGTRIRKLTPIECERLQTLPDNYTSGVSDTQRYKQLGNGWTVDVISHILSYIKRPSR